MVSIAAGMWLQTAATVWRLPRPGCSRAAKLHPLRAMLLAALVELLQISDHVIALLFVVEAAKGHLRVWYYLLRRRQPRVQCRLVPLLSGLLACDKSCGVSVVR